MEKYAGVWVDHKKAFIVTISGGNVSVKKLDSDVEPHFRLSGGYRTANPSGASTVSERKPEERHKHQLKYYYQKIIQNIKEAKEIMIFGPGEAKGELGKAVKEEKELAGRIRDIEPADKMTENQIIARVREFFSDK
jgi:hypothetical protein